MAFGEVISNYPIWIIVGLLCFSSSSAHAVPTSQIGGKGQPQIKTINETDLIKKLDGRERYGLGFHLVDLRNEVDFLKGFIPGAINIPSKKLSFIAEKVFSKADEVVFYSHSKTNHASQNAVIFMKNKGYLNCYVFSGGLDNWTGIIEQKNK